MHLHEYQAKQLFSEYGIPVPQGRMIVLKNCGHMMMAEQPDESLDAMIEAMG